jgi:hypothetical protein
MRAARPCGAQSIILLLSDSGRGSNPEVEAIDAEAEKAFAKEMLRDKVRGA